MIRLFYEGEDGFACKGTDFLHTEDNKCLLLKNVLMLRKLETKSGKKKLQMEAEAQINFRDKILKFVV